jgi:hypothetical protein
VPLVPFSLGTQPEGWELLDNGHGPSLRVRLARALERPAKLVVDARWSLVEKSRMIMPVPFFVMLVAWLSLLFASFGLFAPKNATVMTFLLLGASAIAGCVFIILELGAPSQGVIQPSADPLLRVIEELQISRAFPRQMELSDGQGNAPDSIT